MNNIKKIAIVGHFTGENSFGISKPYLFFWQRFGEVSLISPFENHVRDVDLLVMPGGQDVDPYRYLSPEDDTHIYTGSPCMQKERFDRFLLPKYMEANIPVFCTCRGMQSMYVTLGGKLNQHMSHETNPSHDGGKLVHGITFENQHIIPGFAEITQHKPGEYKINSRHHQTVNEETKPEIVTILARHSTDNEIEFATTYPFYPCHMTQHHVEDTSDPATVFLIKHLLTLNDE